MELFNLWFCWFPLALNTTILCTTTSRSCGTRAFDKHDKQHKRIHNIFTAATFFPWHSVCMCLRAFMLLLMCFFLHQGKLWVWFSTSNLVCAWQQCQFLISPLFGFSSSSCWFVFLFCPGSTVGQLKRLCISLLCHFEFWSASKQGFFSRLGRTSSKNFLNGCDGSVMSPTTRPRKWIVVLRVFGQIKCFIFDGSKIKSAKYTLYTIYN